MANTLNDLMPKILAIALVRLRNRLALVRAVNTDYSREAASRGSVINIPKPPSLVTRAVVPGVTPVAAPGVTEETIPIALDEWHEVPLAFTDKDRLEAIDQSVVMAVEAAADALVDKISASVFAVYPQIYEYVGTAGTTPFASDYALATAARKILNRNKGPLSQRFMVIDPDAEEKATNLGTFADAGYSADKGVIQEGDIGRKVGFDWRMDQQVPSHTLGAAGTVLVDQADVAIGDKTVHFDGLTTKASVGDVFTVAGDTQTYTVVSATDLATTDGDMTFEPAAKVAWADNAAVTFKASHVVNLAVHRDCIALAMRPFRAPASNANVMTMIDSVSGLPLRLEVSRQNKQDYWSLDALWGVKVIRPELGVRVAG